MKNWFSNIFFSLFISLLLFVSNGCAPLLLKKECLDFSNISSPAPIEEANDSELQSFGIDAQKGIVLQFKGFNGMVQEYIDEGIVFSQIENDKGIPIILRTKTNIEFLQQNDDEWIIKMKTSSDDKYSANFTRIYRMNKRGRINLIEGEGKTPDGTLKITEWFRSEIFPEYPVKPGDKWNYTERMKTSLHSFWLEKTPDIPEELNAISTFSGFVKIQDRIYALITTKAMQRKKEKIKTIFKEISLDTNSYITESLYFDFLNGRIEERTIEIESFSSSDLDEFYNYTKAKIKTFYKRE